MLIIDRFEGKWAVIEADDRTTFNLPRNLLPAQAQEGDVIQLLTYVDKELTEARRKKINSMLEFDE